MHVYSECVTQGLKFQTLASHPHVKSCYIEATPALILALSRAYVVQGLLSPLRAFKERLNLQQHSRGDAQLPPPKACPALTKRGIPERMTCRMGICVSRPAWVCMPCMVRLPLWESKEMDMTEVSPHCSFTR